MFLDCSNPPIVFKAVLFLMGVNNNLGVDSDTSIGVGALRSYGNCFNAPNYKPCNLICFLKLNSCNLCREFTVVNVTS